MMRVVVSISLIFLLVNVGVGLDNGIALTPPMGWLTWERYRCIIDCDARPDECISEKLILKTADLMVSEGYLAAGYEYVGIDDCWLEMERDSQGRLVPDRKRFPNGMKFVGDYLHDKGLKFGIYQDYGTATCEGYPGILGSLEIDANTFAEWGADYVKLDGCNVELELMDEGYPEFGMHLNLTGRPMLYSCSWPVYQDLEGMQPNWTSIMEHCNMWRNYYDIQDSWSSVKLITDYFGANSKRLATLAGPGHWNDPDMLIIGNYGLSYDQSKVQMAIWAILAAPLLISTDLKNIKPEMKEIILNKDIIAVNQDSLAKAGILLSKLKNIEVWRRDVVPLVSGQPSAVFAVVNLNEDGAPKDVSLNFKDLGIVDAADYKITDLFEPSSTSWKIIENKDDTKNITVRVNPTGVQMFKVVAVV